MFASNAAKRKLYEPNKALKISIEGNIATGKSTFINLLQEFNKTDWHVVPEPVSEWTKVPDSEKVVRKSSPIKTTPSPIKDNIRLPITSPTKASPIRSPRKTGTESVISEDDGVEDDEADDQINCASAANLLELFYTDTSRWAYTFQSYALLSRMRLQRKQMPKRLRNVNDPVLFYERSLYTDRYIFAKNCHESNLMSDLEWDIYSDWSDYLLDTVGDLHIQGVIYLRADPEISHSRLGKRGRPEESGVTLEYLKNLNNKHEAWLHHRNVVKHPSLYDVPILELNCDQEFETDEAYTNELMGKVKTFLEECKAEHVRRRIELMEQDKENTVGKRLRTTDVSELKGINISEKTPTIDAGGDTNN